MPCRVELLIEFLLDIGSNVLLDIIPKNFKNFQKKFFFSRLLFKSLSCTINRLSLHFFRHIGIFNNCLSITHFFSLAKSFLVARKYKESL